MTGFTNERRADVIYINFRKVFDTVSHNILASGWRETRWVKNSLEKRIVVNGSYSARRLVKILQLVGKVKASCN